MNAKRNTNTNKEKVTGRKKTMVGCTVVKITDEDQVEMVKNGTNLDGNETTLRWTKPLDSFKDDVGHSAQVDMTV